LNINRHSNQDSSQARGLKKGSIAFFCLHQLPPLPYFPPHHEMYSHHVREKTPSGRVYGYFAETLSLEKKAENFIKDKTDRLLAKLHQLPLSPSESCTLNRALAAEQSGK
jgi:hypothetical protein